MRLMESTKERECLLISVKSLRFYNFASPDIYPFVLKSSKFTFGIFFFVFFFFLSFEKMDLLSIPLNPPEVATIAFESFARSHS